MRDGHGIKTLIAAGIGVAVISGRRSSAVTARMRELGVSDVAQGVERQGARACRTAEAQRHRCATRRLPRRRHARPRADGGRRPARSGRRRASGRAGRGPSRDARGGGRGAVREFCDWLLRRGARRSDGAAPSLFAALIALFGVLCNGGSSTASRRRRPRRRQRPGYFLTGVDLEEFGADGTLAHRPAIHLGQRGSGERHRPAGRRRGRLPRADRPALASHGGRSARAARRARHRVRRRRAASAARRAKTRAAAELDTARMTLDTVSETAQTRAPVELAFGSHRMHALGMRADLKSRHPATGCGRQWPLHAVARLAAALLAACAAAAARRTATQLADPGQGELDRLRLPERRARCSTDVTITQGADAHHRRPRRRDRRSTSKDSHWEFNGTRPHLDAGRRARERYGATCAFSGGEIASAAVTGAPATFEQQRKEEHAEGRANRIDYDLKRGTVELTGDAWLKDARTEITSETLVYSTVNQRVISKEPVVITIQPTRRPRRRRNRSPRHERALAHGAREELSQAQGRLVAVDLDRAAAKSSACSARTARARRPPST